MTSTTGHEIPVVELGRWDRGGADAGAAAREIVDVCHRIGFFVVDDHGVPPTLFDDVDELMHRLFALPVEVKETIDKRHSPHIRGWERIGSESTNGRPDIREQVDLWTEHPARTPRPDRPSDRLLGPNQWFADDVLPGSADLVGRWIAALRDVADRLLAALSVGLGLDADHLRPAFDREPMPLLKLIRYPPTPDGGAGVNAHHDTGFLTVLAAGETPGLEVEAPDRTWIAVPPSRHRLVVNLGEMLQAMTGNYLVATPHRVITETERFSAAYFHGPSLDTELLRLPVDPSFAAVVEASPRHRDAGFMAPRHETIAGVGDMASTHRASTYGEQLWNYFVRSYPDIVAEHHPEVDDARASG